jgi:hypothetical protein
MASQHEWTEQELALHVAYELSPGIRRRYSTYQQAMAEPLISKTLSLVAKAWLRQQQHAGERNE